MIHHGDTIALRLCRLRVVNAGCVGRTYWFRNAILGAREMQKGAHERPSYLQFIKVLHANKFFVVCRNLACDCANLKVVVANFAHRCDLCGGAG